jgi:hypothetical protein
LNRHTDSRLNIIGILMRPEVQQKGYNPSLRSLQMDGTNAQTQGGGLRPMPTSSFQFECCSLFNSNKCEGRVIALTDCREKRREGDRDRNSALDRPKRRVAVGDGGCSSGGLVARDGSQRTSPEPRDCQQTSHAMLRTAAYAGSRTLTLHGAQPITSVLPDRVTFMFIFGF